MLVVFKFIKLAVIGLFAFAIYSATPEERTEMYGGARALAGAVVSVCTRPESPCTVGISQAKRAMIAMLKDAYPSDEPVRPSDEPYAGTPRHSFDTRPDPNRDIYRR